MKNLTELMVKNLKASLSNKDYKRANETVIAMYEYMKDNNIKELKDDSYCMLKEIQLKAKVVLERLIICDEMKSFKLFNNILRMINSIMNDIDVINTEDKEIKYNVSQNQNQVNEAEKLLNESINNNVLITTYDESIRGIGKSRALVKKANELDCTLVTYSSISKRYLDEIAQNLNIQAEVKYYNNVDSPRGSRLRNGKFLVDEGVSKDVILKLIDDGNELLGGFIDLHTNHRV